VGITIARWQKELIEQLQQSGYHVEASTEGTLILVEFSPEAKLVLHLISFDQGLQPKDIKTLQERCASSGLQLIQIWEDIWKTRAPQVLSRIRSLTGGNQKIHGRKTTVVTISQAEADNFLVQYHLQGSAKSRYRFALAADAKQVAVATFSAKRKMTRRAGEYYSVELIRFATAEGVTVQGGLSKLIKHLTGLIAPNDVMSYADLDWSEGKGYLRLGFELAEKSPASLIWLNTRTLKRVFPHRLPVEVLEACPAAGMMHFPADLELQVVEPAEQIFQETVKMMQSLKYVPVFNTGNKKYVLYL
jgi:hypothetical protein